MRQKMWSLGVALPLLLLLGSVSGGPMVNGDGLLLRETWSDLWFDPVSAQRGYYLWQLSGRMVSGSGPSPSDVVEAAPYHCPQNGFFPKYGSCSEYYQCEEISEPGMFTAYSFTCPSGMVFDDILDTCDLASQITTRPECMTGKSKHSIVSTDGTNRIDLLADISIESSPFQKRQKRSGQKNEIQCSTENTVVQMANSTNDICIKVHNVENYVNLVLSMIPLREYHEENEEVSKLLEDYDRDLEKAQTNAKDWRDGESIILAIGQTIKLAKQFEPQFQSKYNRNKERVETIKANVDEEKLINNTKNDIKYYEESILNTTKIINSLPEEHRSGLQSVKESFEIKLAEKRLELKENFTLSRELDELIFFLEFVRTDATKIRTAANETRKRIEVFRHKLDGDRTAFKRHYNISKLTLEKNKNETIENNKKLAEIEKVKMELDKKIEKQRQEIQELYQNITNIHTEAFNSRSKIVKSDSFSTKQLIGIGLLVAPVPGARLAGAALLISASADEKNRFEQLNRELTSATNLIASKNNQIRIGNQEIARLQQKIIDGSNSSMNIKTQLHDYTILNRDLKTMNFQLDELIPAIEKAISGVDSLKCLFISIIDKLDSMITYAKEAKTESEKLNVRFFIYNNISQMEDNWNGAYELIMNLDTCSGLVI